ncbi:MAG: twin-arginine translocase TatA/TatE family subunit [Synergistaceae bacterium]|jgi:sec-independent protein translocase protein TatA|nr:twin-arginine translocase TatA/TatE family subunit [Synergistaceae bacterium]
MNLGISEILLLIVLALVLFGPKRLPEMGRAAGNAIREFRAALSGVGGAGLKKDDAENPGGDDAKHV